MFNVCVFLCVCDCVFSYVLVEPTAIAKRAMITRLVSRVIGFGGTALCKASSPVFPFMTAKVKPGTPFVASTLVRSLIKYESIRILQNASITDSQNIISL